jgi:hypothetical protein
MNTTDRPTTVQLSHRAGIRTRYYGPGNVRGSRITAWRADDPSPRADSMSVTVSWDYALGIAENHAAAIEQYIAGHNAAGHDWSGRWIVGAGDDGYFAVWAPEEDR